MKVESCMYLDEKQKKTAYADLSVNNEDITETAGFIPLDVRFKQLEEGGYIAQFQKEEFTSSDYRQAFFSPDFEITPEDEYEEIQEKLNARKKFFDEIAAKAAGREAETGEAGKAAEAALTKQNESVDTEEEDSSEE